MMNEAGPTYLNPQLILAYVREVVQRQTIKGGGHENGISIDNIVQQFCFIFRKSESECPISRLDIQKALTFQVNGNYIFRATQDLTTRQILWSVLPEKISPQSYFESNATPLRPNVFSLQQKRSPLLTFDAEQHLFDESDYLREIELLKTKKEELLKVNSQLRLQHKLLTNPNKIEIVNMDFQYFINSQYDSAEYLEHQVNEAIQEIDYASK